MIQHKKILLLCLFLVSSIVSLKASAPMSQSAHGNNFVSNMFGNANASMEALTKLRMLEMFAVQNLSSKEAAKLQPYKASISYLNDGNVSQEQRYAIMDEAWKKCAEQNKRSSHYFWKNVQSIILDPEKNYMTPEDRARMQQEMANNMISQARQITHPITSILENAVTIGIAMGIVDCMQKVIGESCSRIVNKIPSVISFMERIASKGYNTMCNRPDPLNAEEVLIWEQSFECLINSLTEHSVTGNLMIKNIRVSENEQSAQTADLNWIFLAQNVKEICGHINEFLGDRLLYYTGCKHQRHLLVKISHAVSVENRNSIAFIIKMIITNLNQLIEVCNRAQSSDDLDRIHIKKLGRITLLLFNKLRVMIGGSQGVVALGHSGYQASSGLAEH